MKVREYHRHRGCVRARRLVGVTCCVLILAGSPTVFAHHDPSERIAELSRRIALDPENGALYVARGELHRVEGDRAAAEADFRTAIALDPGDDLATLRLGTTLFETGRFHQAAVWLDPYIDRHPSDVPARITRARVRAGLHDPGGALEDWQAAIPLARASSSDAPEHYLEMARALVDCDRPADAVAALDDGSARLGRPIVLELRALEIEVDLRRFDDAVARVSRVERSATRRERWAALRAEILEQAGLRKEAIGAYRESLAAIEALPASRRATVHTLESRVRASLERLSAEATADGRDAPVREEDS